MNVQRADIEVRAVVEQACQPVRQSRVDERYDGLSEGQKDAMGRDLELPRRLSWTDRPGGLSPRWGEDRGSPLPRLLYCRFTPTGCRVPP